MPSILRTNIVPYLGTMKLSQLTVPLVRDFRDRLRKDGRSPAMIKRVLGDLGSILSDAQERGLVAQNVVRSMQPQRKKQHGTRAAAQGPSSRWVWISPRLRRSSPSSHTWTVAGAPLLLTAIFTGLRASELRGLRWDYVDFKKAELHVRQRADKFKSIGRPKTTSGQRVVPMPPILVNTLREWKLACPKSELGLVFPTGAGRVEYHSNIVVPGSSPSTGCRWRCHQGREG